MRLTPPERRERRGTALQPRAVRRRRAVFNESTPYAPPSTRRARGHRAHKPQARVKICGRKRTPPPVSRLKNASSPTTTTHATRATRLGYPLFEHPARPRLLLLLRRRHGQLCHRAQNGPLLDARLLGQPPEVERGRGLPRLGGEEDTLLLLVREVDRRRGDGLRPQRAYALRAPAVEDLAGAPTGRGATRRVTGKRSLSRPPPRRWRWRAAGSCSAAGARISPHLPISPHLSARRWIM